MGHKSVDYTTENSMQQTNSGPIRRRISDKTLTVAGGIP